MIDELKRPRCRPASRYRGDNNETGQGESVPPSAVPAELLITT